MNWTAFFTIAIGVPLVGAVMWGWSSAVMWVRDRFSLSDPCTFALLLGPVLLVCAVGAGLTAP